MRSAAVSLFPTSVLVLLAWGALAFGAEYAWAYAPLLVLSVVAGALGVRASRGMVFTYRAFLLALAAVFLAGVVQALPLPPAVRGPLRTTVPSVDYGRLYAAATMQPSAKSDVANTSTMSIAPKRTILGLAFLASFALLLMGCARGISAVGPRTLARGVVILGVVVAFVGIIQAAVQSETVYGFWRQPKPVPPFAPFINQNHFAGWMAMATSLSMGWFSGGVASGPKGALGWRNRILWFSSPPASKTLLTAFGVAVMAISIVITRSRGGLVGLVTAILISCWWVMGRQSSVSRRLIGAGCLVVILIVAATWGAAEKTIDRFEGASVDIAGRRGIWEDAWHVVQDYPLTGTGLNTFGIAMLHYQTVPRAESVIEAHNDYLQLAAEGGLLLGLPILIALGLFVREVWRRFSEAADDPRTYWLRAGAVTGLGAIAVPEAFDFTLQMPGAAVLFVILGAIAIHRPDYIRRHSTDAPGSADGLSR